MFYRGLEELTLPISPRWSTQRKGITLPYFMQGSSALSDAHQTHQCNFETLYDILQTSDLSGEASYTSDATVDSPIH